MALGIGRVWNLCEVFRFGEILVGSSDRIEFWGLYMLAEEIFHMSNSIDFLGTCNLIKLIYLVCVIHCLI